MSVLGQFCSLIPGLGVKLSTIVLAGPTVPNWFTPVWNPPGAIVSASRPHYTRLVTSSASSIPLKFGTSRAPSWVATKADMLTSIVFLETSIPNTPSITVLSFHFISSARAPLRTTLYAGSTLTRVPRYRPAWTAERASSPRAGARPFGLRGLTPVSASNQGSPCDRRLDVAQQPIAIAGSNGLPVFRTPKHSTNSLRIAATTICLGLRRPRDFNRATSATIAGLCRMADMAGM